jgi:hypothetical protein
VASGRGTRNPVPSNSHRASDSRKQARRERRACLEDPNEPTPTLLFGREDWNKTAAVDLRGRFSNPEVRAMVLQVAQLADGIKVEEDQQERPALAPQRQRWRLVDRLGEQTIQDLLKDRRAGTTQRRLAERYGISLSSVKRVLRRHRC